MPALQASRACPRICYNSLSLFFPCLRILWRIKTVVQHRGWRINHTIINFNYARINQTRINYKCYEVEESQIQSNTIIHESRKTWDSNPEIYNGKSIVRRAQHWAIAITDKYKLICVLALSPCVSGTSSRAPADWFWLNREPVTLLMIQIPNNHLRYDSCSLPSSTACTNL